MEITKRVLKTWHLVEALVPSEVPGKGETVKGSYFTDNKNRNRTRLIDLNETPWKNDIVKENDKFQVQFRYYFACFEHHKLVSFIREAFMNQDEIVNKENKTLFSFSFLVDDQGNYIKESIFVPFLMYVIQFLAKASEVKYEDLLTPFQSKLKLFEEQAQTIFINGVTKESLLLIQQEYQQFFHRLDDNSLHYLEIEVMRAGQISKQKNFNSFYISDLELILKKGENEALSQFVEGVAIEKRLDINENQEYIEDVLQPIHLPDGRWPSPVEHRLSLMQQVAVNQIINSNQKISSVNGPPGTGKTTLLKDIFADIVVQRAEKIVQLDTPTQAFTKVKTINLNSQFYPIYLLDSSIKEYSMVVASSNNGAVENISKDLPKRDEVIRSSGKSKFNHYEESYAVEAQDLSMYKVAAMDLLGSNDEAWGLFSGALGKSDNISTYAWSLFRKKEDGTSFLQQLEQDSKQVNTKDWENAVKEFEDTLNSVKKKKESLQKYHDEYKSIKSSIVLLRELEEQLPELNQELMDLGNGKSHLEQQKQLTEQQIRSLPKLSLLQKVLGKKNIKKIELENELYDIITQLKDEGDKFYIKKTEVEKSKKMIEELKERESAFTKHLEDYKMQGLILPDEDYWSDTQQAYEFRQLNTIWLTDELNFERGLLFLKAMKIHKMMLAFNFDAIKSTLRLLINRANLDLNDMEHREYLKNMWQTVHLITPLVSTTFASFSSMYKGIEKDFIQYLFIDEAGQASPQQSAGAIWRSKNVVVVGDPIQIEPVITLDQTILGDIKKYFNVNDRYIGMGTSVQTIADTANRYGMTNGYGQWIGIPLWVHRRCLNPMFTVANEIAYDNKMVLGKEGRGKSIWYDCKGSAKNRQFVEEQGELAADHIIELWKKNNAPPNVYIISPFTAVKDGIKKILKARLKKFGISTEILNDWLRNSIGTVHTFQGKEADIVYLVTGTDENGDGAANWSCSKPNLLNVAVTRAKKEFYVIGDYQRFSKKLYYSSIVENVDEVKSGSRI
ncbi:DEAD/DEAH box helicase [Paenibacillus gallinarum]|uniref:ATP-binding protein n=1 Tax=Paenibacillus gallinarum TaxID=2762232 RepID=A0ABR8T1B6_9BACL|nr:ATP-binding protein [Paenibacillus gallinarum]MBD7969420.1 ATP-binding protein [Paenibacillus gallinarum]